MPLYKISAPNGKTYQIEGPEGASQKEIEQEVMRQHPMSAYTTQELENAPRVKGTTGDIARETGQGVLGGIQSLTDIFGANNFASKYLQEKNKSLSEGLTPERQQELQIEQELSKRAEGDTYKEITTGLKNVLRHPFTSMASGLGSSVPLIAGTVLAPEAMVGRAALGIGSLMGLGGQKGQNYQAVYDEAIRQNKTPQEAEALALKAQEYSLQNAPGLALGAGLGALEGELGAGARIGKFFNPAQAVEGASRGIAAPTFGKALGKSSLEGGGTEFLQGSGAQVASNMALSQAGFDTPLLQGAFGAGAHDALIGALTGTAVSPLQLSTMKREYDEDQVKKLFEDNEKAAKEKEATQAKFNKEMGVKPEILALPAPAQEITEKPTDKLQNPLGNFTPEELGPERVNAIDQHRAANNKPPLKTYSIEDIVDAMPKTAPEAERGALNELVANKAGATLGYSNQKVSTQDVLNAAAQKGIDTDTQGFKDFLTRATGLPSVGVEEKAATSEAFKNKPLGLSELEMMTDAQRFVAQQSLLQLPTKEGEKTILPAGTNATHYDQDQYLKALEAVDALHNKGKPATQEEALGEIKKSTGLTRDEDAQYLLRDAVRRGDFDLNEKDEIVPAETATYLPEGHRIEEASLKEGEAPEHYEVKAGDKVLSTAPTEAEAQAKLERYKAIREKDSADIDKEIADKQKAVEKSNENVERMEARGLGRTPEYQKASAAHSALVAQTNKEIGDLNRDKAALDLNANPLSVKPGEVKPVKRKTFKLHKAKAGEASTQVGSYPTRQAAEQAITSNMSESELEDLAKDTRRRTLARRARQELNDRRTEKIKVRREFKQVSGDIAKEFESFLAKIGLKGVGLKLMSTLGGSEGEYNQSLIKVALDTSDPLGVLRHESIHALKNLGFFSDNQWNALRRMAKDKWIKQFMKDVPYSEGVSRYDAYKSRFESDPPAGVTFQEYIEEEAIADAFRYFHENGTPPGMIAAILKRLNQFFEALRNALNNGGFYTADDIFEKIEKGELVSTKQGTAETKASLKTAKWAEKEEAPNKFGREDALRRMYRKLNNAYTETDSPAEAYDLAYESSSPAEQRILRALKKDDFLGFDYPHQAIHEIIENPENYDISTPLKVALSVVGNKEGRASLKTPLSTREIMEQNDQFAQAELGLNIKKMKGKTGVNNVRDIAKALNAQTVNEEGAMNRLSHTVKDEDRIAKAMADEVGYQLRATAKTGTGLGWYSNNYPNAVKRLATRFPELENNRHARAVFSALVAVTSNGERVAKNIDNAIKLYSKLRDGKPLVAMGNRRASALSNKLIAIENLLRTHGTDFEEVLLKEITVKDMNAYLRSIGEESDSSYLANTVIPSAAIYFGPKLGAFYANLSGSEGYLTMDLWWTRSINRMRGLLIPKATKASIDKFAEMLDQPDASVNDLVEQAIPLRNRYEENDFVTDLEFLAGGKEPAKKVLKGAWFKRAEAAAGDAYDQFLFEHNLLKMANTIYKNEFEMLEEAPFSATDRAFMYKAARKAQALLRNEGVDLTLADIQAALWYYEKRLYAKLSGRIADDTGYEEAIIKQANKGNRSVRPSVVFSGQQNGGNVSTGAVQLSQQPSSATVKASLKGIVAEVAPNPDQEIATRWRLMNSADKQQTTEVVARRVIPKLFDDMGFKGWSYNISSGRYEGEQNPNIIINAPDSATDEELNEFAKVIGNVFDQKAMVTYDEDNTTSDSQNGFVSVIIPDGMDDQTLTNLRDHIAKEVPEANADTVRDGKIHFGNFSKYTDNEISDEQYYNNIKDAIANFNYDGIIDIQKPIQFHSELIEPANREEYLEGTRYGEDQGSREKAGGDNLWRQGRNRLEAISEDAISLRNKWIESRTKPSEGSRSGATTFPNVETEYGTPIENASSAVGVHFSKQKRGTIVSKFYGTGLKGLEGKRLSEPTNKDIKDRIYFYVDKGKGIVAEAGVGNAAHVVRLNNLYDTVKDPLKIIKNNKGETENDRASNLERNIKNAGFDGYMFMDPLQSQGYAVLIGDHNIPVPPSRASLKAPNTPAFKRFFGNSKVVDANGEPLVVYHATKNFEGNEFKPSPKVNRVGNPDGYYFTYDIEDANKYAGETEGAQIIPVYLSIQNPFNYVGKFSPSKKMIDQYEKELRQDNPNLKDDWINAKLDQFKDGYWPNISFPTDAMTRVIKAGGYDGMKDGRDWVAFDSNQIKSATGNIGTFDSTNPDIRYSLKAPETPAFKRFFGDSKITDKNGEPMVMYHATNSDFNVFNRSDDGKLGEGIYSTSIPQYANEFAPKGNVMPLFVHAENPFVINVTRGDIAFNERFSGDINKAMVKAVADFTDGKTRLMDLEGNQVRELFEKNGYDGIVVKDDQGNIIEANVFTPTQVKSAIGNTGTYSISNPDIRYSLASRLQTMPNRAAGDKRVNETTTTRDEVGHAQRMIQAIQGDTFSKIRQRFFNRYQRIGEFDKRVAKMRGVVKLLADTAAESAALMSDYANGVAYKALGFNGKGGIPEFKNQVVTVNQKTKGPVEIFATLAKFGDPKVYQYYQFWAGVQRGSRYIKNNNGVYEEKLFNDPADIQLAKDYEKAFPEFVQVQKEWIEYNNGLVKFLVDTGVLSAARANEFTKYSDYIPFYRQFDDETTIGPQLFQSMSAVKAPKRAKGGEAPLADFLETIVRNTQSSIQAGMKAVAAKRAIDNALELKEAEQVTANERSKFDVIQVYDKGELKFYRVNDPLYLEAMKGLNLPEIPFLGILAKPADWLRTLVTKEPGFMLANMMKDSMQTYITSGSNMKPIIETAANFATALAGKNPTVERLKAAGLGGNAHFVGDISKSGKDFAKILRKESGQQTTTEKALKPFTSLWDALGHGTEASDLATRAAVYDRVMDETGNEAEAIFQAVETMNFYRHGNSAIVRILTAVTPFLNARMQGLDVFYRAGFAPTVARLTGRGDQVTQADLDKQKTFMIRSAGVIAMSVAYWALTHDDDEYKKQEQETRDNNWLIPALGIKIPIPFEVGFLFKVLPERIMEYTMGSDTGQDFAKSMYRGIEQTFGIQFPQAFAPIFESSINYSFFTQRAIVPPGLENVDPEFQVGPSTSNVAEMIGKSIGSSPMKIDHIIKGYTGTLGMYMVDLVDSVMDINSNVPKASKRFEQMPFIKRFALDPEARGTVSSYYELKNNVDQVVRTINLLEKNGDFENLPQYAQDNAGLWASHDFVLSLDKQMKEYQQYATMIRNSGMDADEKRDALSAVHEAQNALTSNIQYIRKMISQQ